MSTLQLEESQLQVSSHQTSPPVASPPVPSSAGSSVSSDVRCGSCQFRNVRNREFCSECGEPLWVKCPACHIRIGSDEKFCGGCGVNLVELVEQTIAVINDFLAESNRLEGQQRFSDAARELRRLERIDHPRLNSLFEQMAAKHERLQELARKQSQWLEQELSHIRKMIESNAFEEAIRNLEALSEIPRPREVDDMLAVARMGRDEIRRLKSEIKRAIANKKYLNLAPCIERLQVLTPGDCRLETLDETVAPKCR